MLSDKTVRKHVFRLISIFIVHAIILNDLSFALAAPTRHLAAPSRFNPIVNVVPGIQTEIKFRINSEDIALRHTKEAFKRKVVYDGIYRRISGNIDNFEETLLELIKNSYDSFIDKLEESSPQPADMELVIRLEAYYDGNDIVVNVTDNGKPVELQKDGKPGYRHRTFRKHFGGWRRGIRMVAEPAMRAASASIKWHPIEGGTRTEVRLPKNRVRHNGLINEGEYIAIEAKHDASMMARSAFRDMSIMIGKYLSIGISEHTLKKHIKGHAANLQKFINEMKKHIPASEMEWSRSADPVLKGFDIDSLSYNADDNSFSIPVYRGREKAFIYRYYIHGDPKEADITIPLGDGTSVFVKVQAIPGYKTPAEYHTAAAGSRKDAPAGSIPAVFAFLCDRGITSAETAMTAEDIAKNLGRSYETIKYDIRGLYRHLRLIDKPDSRSTGRHARYYVPDSVRMKAAAIAPALGLFRDNDIRPTRACLELVRELFIRPAFSSADLFREDSSALGYITQKFQSYYHEITVYLGRMKNGKWTKSPKAFYGRVSSYRKMMEAINANFIKNFDIYCIAGTPLSEKYIEFNNFVVKIKKNLSEIRSRAERYINNGEFDMPFEPIREKNREFRTDMDAIIDMFELSYQLASPDQQIEEEAAVSAIRHPNVGAPGNDLKLFMCTIEDSTPGHAPVNGSVEERLLEFTLPQLRLMLNRPGLSWQELEALETGANREWKRLGSIRRVWADSKAGALRVHYMRHSNGWAKIPALTRFIEIAGNRFDISAENRNRLQTLAEQTIFWAISLALTPFIGNVQSIGIAWSAFFLAHFIRSKNMPQAPPWHRILTVTLINAAALCMPQLISGFVLATIAHHIVNTRGEYTPEEDPGEVILSRDDQAVPDRIFKALGLNRSIMQPRNYNNGFNTAIASVSRLNKEAVISAFGLPENSNIEETDVLVISYGAIPVSISLVGKETPSPTIFFSAYYNMDEKVRMFLDLHAASMINDPIGAARSARYAYIQLNDKKEFSRAGLEEFDGALRVPILPGVFHGTHGSSAISAKATGILARPGMKVLILGTGLGLESTIAALRGAEVEAVDIKEMAVENTMLTAEKAGASVRAHTSDLFSRIGKNEKYDLIVFNMPHVFMDRPTAGSLNLSGSQLSGLTQNTADREGILLSRLAPQLSERLNDGGIAILVNSKNHADFVMKTLEGYPGMIVTKGYTRESLISQAYMVYKSADKKVPGPGQKSQPPDWEREAERIFSFVNTVFTDFDQESARVMATLRAMGYDGDDTSDERIQRNLRNKFEVMSRQVDAIEYPSGPSAAPTPETRGIMYYDSRFTEDGMTDVSVISKAGTIASDPATLNMVKGLLRTLERKNRLSMRSAVVNGWTAPYLTVNATPLSEDEALLDRFAGYLAPFIYCRSGGMVDAYCAVVNEDTDAGRAERAYLIRVLASDTEKRSLTFTKSLEWESRQGRYTEAALRKKMMLLRPDENGKYNMRLYFAGVGDGSEIGWAIAKIDRIAGEIAHLKGRLEIAIIGSDIRFSCLAMADNTLRRSSPSNIQLKASFEWIDFSDRRQALRLAGSSPDFVFLINLFYLHFRPSDSSGQRMWQLDETRILIDAVIDSIPAGAYLLVENTVDDKGSIIRADTDNLFSHDGLSPLSTSDLSSPIVATSWTGLFERKNVNSHQKSGHVPTKPASSDMTLSKSDGPDKDKGDDPGPASGTVPGAVSESTGISEPGRIVFIHAPQGLDITTVEDAELLWSGHDFGGYYNQIIRNSGRDFDRKGLYQLSICLDEIASNTSKFSQENPSLNTALYKKNSGKGRGSYVLKYSFSQEGKIREAAWGMIEENLRGYMASGPGYLTDIGVSGHGRRKGSSYSNTGHGFITVGLLMKMTPIVLEYKKTENGLQTTIWVELDNLLMPATNGQQSFELASNLTEDQLYDSGIGALVMQAQKDAGFWAGWRPDMWDGKHQDAMVIFRQGKPIGIYAFIIDSDKEIQANGIYISKEARGYGTGTELRNEMIKYLGKRQYKTLKIGGVGVNRIRPSEEAQRFHKKLGNIPGIKTVTAEDGSVLQVKVDIEKYMAHLKKEAADMPHPGRQIPADSRKPGSSDMTSPNEPIANNEIRLGAEGRPSQTMRILKDSINKIRRWITQKAITIYTRKLQKLERKTGKVIFIDKKGRATSVRAPLARIDPRNYDIERARLKQHITYLKSALAEDADSGIEASETASTEAMQRTSQASPNPVAIQSTKPGSSDISTPLEVRPGQGLMDDMSEGDESQDMERDREIAKAKTDETEAVTDTVSKAQAYTAEAPTSGMAPAAAELHAARIEAIEFSDAIKLIKKASASKQPVILALGTSWIKGYNRGEPRYNDLNRLITAIRNYCAMHGITFINAEDDDLLTEINKKRQDMSDAKIVVLAGKDSIAPDNAILSTLRNDENVFLAAVDNGKLDETCYIRIVEMLRLALELGLKEIFRDKIDLSSPNIDIGPLEDFRNVYVFIPKAERIPIYENLRALYRVQEFA